MLKWTQDDETFQECKSKILWFLNFLMDLVKLKTFKIAIKEMLNSSDKIILKKFIDNIGKRINEEDKSPNDSQIEDIKIAYFKK